VLICVLIQITSTGGSGWRAKCLTQLEGYQCFLGPGQRLDRHGLDFMVPRRWSFTHPVKCLAMFWKKCGNRHSRCPVDESWMWLCHVKRDYVSMITLACRCSPIVAIQPHQRGWTPFHDHHLQPFVHTLYYITNGVVDLVIYVPCSSLPVTFHPICQFYQWNKYKLRNVSCRLASVEMVHDGVLIHSTHIVELILNAPLIFQF